MGLKHPLYRLGAMVVVVFGIAASTSGCGLTGGSLDPIVAASFTDFLRPKLSAVVQDGEIGVSPSKPITASVSDGALSAVTLLNPDQQPVPGKVSEDGKSWTNTEALGYGREYTLVAEALGMGGKTESTYKFTTASPENLTQPYVIPSDGETVGIGQPVGIQFDEHIPDRKAVQDAITVTTDPPVEGAFYWLSNREVRWRPEHFWAPGTRVSIDVKVYGKDLGNGVFGTEDLHSEFTIGDAVVMTADDSTLLVTVEKNGEVIRTMPTSMGKAGTPTSNGTYVIADQHRKIIMDSATYGVSNTSPDGYRTEVEYATRMSYSGIFLHSAPWSVGAQGSYNASHGCLNLSPDNAIWVYNNIKRGDVVVVRNTAGGTLSATE